MDFTLPPAAIDSAELTARLLTQLAGSADSGDLTEQEGSFDRELWRALGSAGLLGLQLPADHGGSDQGLLAWCSALAAAGRHTGAGPWGSHGAAARVLAEHGSPAQRDLWLPVAASGAVLLTAGLVEEPGIAVERPQTVGHGRRGGYRLTGTKVAVPALPHADAVLVPAFTDDGTLLFLIHTDDLGVTITPQLLSDGNAVGLLELDAVPVGPERLVGTSSGAATARLLDLAILALCAEQVGVCTGALRATAEYAAAYGQSDQPTGGLPGSQTSQARLADGYIDALCLESAMWQAAWLLDEGRPAAAELATAKFWAAEAGHRIAHTAMHLHGSQGVEPTGTAHRWFTAAKRIEFSLGSATEHALALGKLRLPTRPPGPSRGR